MIGFGWWLATAGATEVDCTSTQAEVVKQAFEDSEAQRDRRATDPEVQKADEQRTKAMAKLARKGELCTAEEKWQAAWIMMQADDVDTLELAYELAVETMEAHYGRGPWLVAYSFDRKRVANGYRQSYGTQTRIDSQGRRCLVEVEPDVTDEQRQKYGHPPIAEVYRKILDMNGFTDDQPTLDRVQRRGLYCEPQAQKRGAGRIAPPQ
ncbi:MAG: hypothetical protein H6738_04590 [Alphaproteobacteria bacterium]|nr:hypothetical protein [Alphaproteobacteria bacterium]MCB9696051.1 hypothetical protein [Alphaproteobacteria bacterium]